VSIRKGQAGFSVFELLLAVVVIAAIAAAGYWVYHKHHTTTPTVSTSTSTTASTSPAAQATNVSSAPQINNTSDLTKAEKILDDNNPATANSSDSSELNSQLSAF